MRKKKDKKESEPTIQSTGKKKKKWGLFFIIILLLVLIGLAAGILNYLFSNQNKSRLARDEDALGGMLEGKTAQEISELLRQRVEEGMVNVSISARPIFEKNGKKGLIGIENLETNRYSFQVRIVVDDDVLYESGLIDPGYSLEYIELDKKLEEGEYDALAIFTTYSPEETDEPIAQANINISLFVMESEYY